MVKKLDAIKIYEIAESGNTDPELSELHKTQPNNLIYSIVCPCT